MLIDSNIIIYAAQREHDELRRFIAVQSPVVSAVSYVEVLGYHRLSNEARRYFEEFFAAATTLAIAEPVLEQAVKLRQIQKMTIAPFAGQCSVRIPYSPFQFRIQRSPIPKNGVQFSPTARRNATQITAMQITSNTTPAPIILRMGINPEP